MRRAWLGLYLRPHIISSWLSFKKLQNVEFCGICASLFYFPTEVVLLTADTQCGSYHSCASNLTFVNPASTWMLRISCLQHFDVSVATFKLSFLMEKMPKQTTFIGEHWTYIYLLFKHINISCGTPVLSRCWIDKAKCDSIQ